MLEALATSTGEVTVASRDVQLGTWTSIRKGSYLGLVDGTAVACHDDFEQVAIEVVERVLQGRANSLDLVVGQDAPPVEPVLEALRRSHPDVEISPSSHGRAGALPAPRRRRVTGVGAIRVLLVEDSDVYRDSLVFPARPRPRNRGRRGAGCDGWRRSIRLCRAGSRRRRDRLPASGRRRLYCCGRGSSPFPGCRGRLPERLCGSGRSLTQRARRSRACAQGRGIDILVGGARGVVRKECSMNLTSENTAGRPRLDLRLPRGAVAVPEHALRPFVRALRRRHVPRLRRARPGRLLLEAAHVSGAPCDRPADAPGLPRRLREPRGIRAHLLAGIASAKVS